MLRDGTLQAEEDGFRDEDGRFLSERALNHVVYEYDIVTVNVIFHTDAHQFEHSVILPSTLTENWINSVVIIARMNTGQCVSSAHHRTARELSNIQSCCSRALTG